MQNIYEKFTICILSPDEMSRKIFLSRTENIYLLEKDDIKIQVIFCLLLFSVFHECSVET